MLPLPPGEGRGEGSPIAPTDPHLERLELHLAQLEARLAQPGYSERTPEPQLHQDRKFRDELRGQIEAARKAIAAHVEPIAGGLPSPQVGRWGPLPLFDSPASDDPTRPPPLVVEEPAEQPDYDTIAAETYEILRNRDDLRLFKLIERWKRDARVVRLLAAAMRTRGRRILAGEYVPRRRVLPRRIELGPTPWLTEAAELPDEFDGLTKTQRLVLHAMGEAAPARRPFMRLSELAAEVAQREPEIRATEVEHTLIGLGHPSLRSVPLVEFQGLTGRFTPHNTHFTHARLTAEGQGVLNETLALPLLLINGAAGDGYCFPPGCPEELLEACLKLLKVPPPRYAGSINGPDFPDGGVLQDPWRLGSSELSLRGRVSFELDEARKQARVVVSELPWGLPASQVLAELNELRSEGHLDGVTAIADHSSATTSAVTIELEHLAFSGPVRDAIEESCCHEIGLNAQIKVRGAAGPRAESFDSLLRAFIEHRKEIAVKRLDGEVARARLRAQNAEAICLALSLLEPVQTVMRAAYDDEEAITGLMNFMKPEYREAITSLPFPASHDYAKGFTREQAKHVVAARKLASRRPDSAKQDWAWVLDETQQAIEKLSDRQAILSVVRAEMQDALQRYGTPRRTRIDSW